MNLQPIRAYAPSYLDRLRSQAIPSYTLPPSRIPLPLLETWTPMRSTDSRLSADSSADARALLIDSQANQPVPGESWRTAFPAIIGRGPAMQKTLESVLKIARTESSVLIMGESGTGKELIADAIHRLSTRSHMPYVPFNTTAVPDTLLENELFGHVRGAFTGADKGRTGRLQQAHRGTLFLDEIGDMPTSLQAKLLRVLQERVFTPLGTNDEKECDFRLIAATHVDLSAAIKDGRFREDLYHRINVLPVRLPALRERREDIPELIQHFVDRTCREQRIDGCYLTEALIRKLSDCQWPGNVRQLQNFIERLIVLKNRGPIDIADLDEEDTRNLLPGSGPSPAVVPASYSPAQAMPAASQRVASPANGQIHVPAAFGQLPSEGLDLVAFIESLENDLIRQALERTGNNRNQAAKLLGLNRTTLVERIKKRRITPLNEPSKEL